MPDARRDTPLLVWIVLFGAAPPLPPGGFAVAYAVAYAAFDLLALELCRDLAGRVLSFQGVYRV